MEEAGIYRNRLQDEGSFTTVRNTWIRSTKLTPQANFLWIYLLSHKIGYELRDSQILTETGFGPKGLRAARQELVDAGWLELRRKTNPDGSFGTYAYHLQQSRVPQGTVEQSTVEQGTVPEGPDIRSTNSKKTINKKTIKRETALPDDWQPKDSVYAEEKYSVLNIDDEAESFRNWCLANGKRYVDWDAAFRNWLKKGLDFYSKKHYKEVDRERSRRELDEWLRKQEGKDDVN